MGKAVALKQMIKGDEVLVENAEVFYGAATTSEVTSAGEKALVSLYKPL